MDFRAAARALAAIEPEEPLGPPPVCSYCGATEFEDGEDHGRGERYTCAACGGTMSSSTGYYQPELIGSPQNHPSPKPDPRSGGVGGAGNVPQRSEDLNQHRAAVPVTSPSSRHSSSTGSERGGVPAGHAGVDPGHADDARHERGVTRVGGTDWCRHRHGGHCWLPRTDSSSASPVALYIPQDRGICPWTTASMQQINCPVSEAGPMAGMERAGMLDGDPELKLHLTATWADVRDKAKRIRAQGGVHIVVSSGDGIGGTIQGDNGTYDALLTYLPASRKVSSWQCDCPWGQWRAEGRLSGSRNRFQGRLCSHAYALQLEAQARGMFGRPVAEDTGSPRWLRAGATRHEYPDPPGRCALDMAGVDLVHPPIYAFAADLLAEGGDPGHAMAVMTTAGLPHVAARSLLTELLDDPATQLSPTVLEALGAVPDQGAHMHIQRTLDRVRDEEHERHMDDAKYAHNDEPLRNSDIPAERHQAWRFQHNSDANPGDPVQDEFHAFFHDIAGWPEEHRPHPTNATDPHQGPVPLTHYHNPRSWERLHLDEHGNAWARHMTSAPRESDGAHTPKFSHWSGPHSASDVLANHPTFSQRTNEDGSHTVNWLSHGQRLEKHHADPTEPHAETAQKANRALAESGWGVISSYADQMNSVSRVSATGSSGSTAADDGPTHAGLVLKADDTGRVLMLQRSMEDEDDPAKGTWEFPGGGIEPGDSSSLHGAAREFAEEVGQKVPHGGTVQHVWQSGPYVGHVLVIPHEHQIALHDGRVVPNPDDPKGDHPEQAAWWDPDHARKNPALREECKTSPWKAIREATRGKQAVVSGEIGSQSCPKCHGQVTTGAAACPHCGKHLESDMDRLDIAHTADYASGDWLEDVGVDPSPWRNKPIPPDGDQPENPGSAGFATAADPPAFNDADSRSMQMPVWTMGVRGELTDTPEPALPSTTGDDDDDWSTDVDPAHQHIPGSETLEQPDARGGMRPEIDPLESMTPSGQTHASLVSAGSVDEIVARFQTTGAAKQLQTVGGPSDMEIAEAARRHLGKTAAATFDFAEQQALINEGAVGSVRTRNFDALDIEGTHYAALEEALASEARMVNPDELFD